MTTCPTCGSQEIISQGTWTTLLGFARHASNGAWHSHDPNTITEHMRCANGHDFKWKHKESCPAPGCDYGKEGAD